MKTLGIVGGGQLGRMMTSPALELGFQVTVLDPTPNCPAAQVGAKQIVGDFKDAEQIKQLAENCDFLTFEIELAHAEVLDELLAGGLTVNPAPHTLAIIKDKFAQKEYLDSLEIPVAPFRAVETPAQVKTAGADLGYPLLL